MRESAQFSACEASFHGSIAGQEAVLVEGQGFTSLMLSTQGEEQNMGERRVRWPSCLGALEPGSKHAGQGQLQRDPAAGQGSVTALESCEAACKANEGRDCSHRCVW